MIKGKKYEYAQNTKEETLELREREISFREKNNLSQEAMAEKCGVNRSTIQRLESRRAGISSVTFARIKRIINENLIEG